MKGSIRTFIGLLVVFGSVGSLDYDPSSSVLLAASTAVVGLLLMYSGVRAMNRDNYHG